MGHKTNCQPRGYGRGALARSGSAHPTNRQLAKKIFNKKGEVIGSFDPERDKRDEQEWLKQGDLTPDGREPAYDEQNDEELCQKFTGKFAAESAKRTNRNNGEVRDRYDTIVIEFLAVRYTQSDGKRYSLGTVLRSKYETDEALANFLPAVGRWLDEYVEAGGKGSWTMSRHVVSENLLTALAEEYKRDRDGLICFLSAIFKHWRQLFTSDSSFRVKLLTQQMETRNVKKFAEYVQEIGAASQCTTAEQVESLHGRIKQYRSRGRKKALEKLE